MSDNDGKDDKQQKKKKSASVLSTKVFVGYLPPTVEKRQIIELFEDYGEIVECDIVKDFAFVHFKRINDAKKAVAGLDGKTFKDIKLHVQISISKLRQRPGMGESAGCYRCGSKEHWSRTCPSNPLRETDDGYEDDFDWGYPPPRDYYRDHDRYYDYYRDRLPPPEFLLPPDPSRRVLLIPPDLRKYYQDPDPTLRPPPEYYKYKALADRDPYAPLPPI